MIHYVRRSANQHFGSIIKMNIPLNPKPHTNSEMDSKTILTNELTDSQIDEVTKQYVEIVVDGMDTKTLVAYAIDQLTAYYNEGSLDDLKEDIDNYQEDLYDELVDNVTQQYPKQLNRFGG